jgi:CheY-like chemotaxis protein
MLHDKDRSRRLSGTDAELIDSSAQSNGSGLEIIIIKQLLGLMDSALEVRDRTHGGIRCSFELTLPVALNERRKLSAERLFSGQRILLAEDNSEIMAFAESLLLSWGMEVDKSETLEGVLDLLAGTEQNETPYSLVLIDSQLGSLPFTLFNEEILATCAEHKLHTILLSCRPDGTETAEHDRISILEKPFTASQLNTAIYHVLAEAPEAISEIIVSKDKDTADEHVRLLVVDDDRMSRELAARILRRAGYSVETAENGMEAVDMIGRYDFDLVLMDLDMPQMDGFESTKRIRQERSSDDLPIIALTANAMNDNADRCYRVGMNDYISKPFQIEKLLHTLNRYKPVHKTTAPTTANDKRQITTE